jgi:hypothetical protein
MRMNDRREEEEMGGEEMEDKYGYPSTDKYRMNIGMIGKMNRRRELKRI